MSTSCQRNFIITISRIFLLIIIISLVASCNYLEEKSFPDVTEAEDPQDTHELERIAILKFHNLTDVPEIEHSLRMYFLSFLSAKGYSVINLKEVDDLLEMAEINASDLEEIEPYKLGRILKADALIYGTITKCSKMFIGIYSKVTVGARVKMVNAKISKTIWAAEHTEKTHGGGAGISPFSLPEEVIDSVLNVRDKVINDTAGRLVHKFVVSMPENPFEIPVERKIISIIGEEETVSYITQEGDTLYNIAEKFYADSSLWTQIKDANNGLNESELSLGANIIVPNMPILDDLSNIHVYKEDETQKIEKVVYKVQWGDNLYKIANALYGNGKKWKAIYENNKESIVSITDVPVGQILILPLNY